MAAVSGTYTNPDGTPASGHILFTLQPAAIDSTGEQRVQGPVSAKLTDGSFTIDLVPDSDLTVEGQATYQVREAITGLSRDPWYLLIADGASVDLPSRYPGDPVGNWAIHPVPGPAGPPGPPGEQGPPGPSTGPAGGDLTGNYPNPTLAQDRVKRSGDIMTGGLALTGSDLQAFVSMDLHSNYIYNLHDPSSAQDAATKQYTDTHISALEQKIAGLEQRLATLEAT